MLVNHILPDGEGKESCGAIYLDKKLLETPIVASGQVIKETIRMANKAKNNLELAMEVFLNWNEEKMKKVYANESIINTLERDITEYLIELSQHNLPEESAKLVSQAYHTINDIERIGDHAENIVELAIQKYENNITLSYDGYKEVRQLFEVTLRSITIAIESFKSNEISDDEVEKVEEEIDSLEKQFRENNINRLSAKTCLADAGIMFFDLLSNLERIGDHANNIATVKEKPNHKIHAELC